jgi:hypothetical protein
MISICVKLDLSFYTDGFKALESRALERTSGSKTEEFIGCWKTLHK